MKTKNVVVADSPDKALREIESGKYAIENKRGVLVFSPIQENTDDSFSVRIPASARPLVNGVRRGLRSNAGAQVAYAFLKKTSNQITLADAVFFAISSVSYDLKMNVKGQL